MIQKWASVLSESEEEVQDEVQDVKETESSRVGISRPDELGKNINGIISKDLFDNRTGSAEDLYQADFKCNISDTGTLVRKFPAIPKDMIPQDCSFIYFMCKAGELDPKRMVDYVNQKCAEVLPERINIDDVIFLGRHDVGQGDQLQDLFVIVNGDYGTARKGQETRQEVADAFAKIKDGYSDEALMVKYGDKEFLTRYLKQNQTALNKLQDKGNYLLMVALKDQLRPAKRVKVANAIGSQVNIFGEHDVEDKDIERIGTLRGKYKATGSVFELDAFVIKAD